MSRRIRRIGLATLTGLALGLIAVEVVLHLWFVDGDTFRGRRPLPPFGATTNSQQREWVARWQRDLAAGVTETGIGGFDPDLGWAMRGSATDGRYASNRLAARGPREYHDAPPDDTFRLLCFGDSFTFCDEVGDTETWPAQLEQIGRAVEAVNFGVGGYGTDQALMRFRSVRDHVGGHAVAIGIMLENIGRNVNRYRPRYYPQTGVAYAKPRFILDPDSGTLQLVPLPFASLGEYIASVADGSVIARLAEHEFWDSGAAPFGNGLASVRLVAGLTAYLERAHRRWWKAPAAEPFRVTVAVLEQFWREAEAWGAAVAPVVIFPAQQDLAEIVAGNPPYWSTLTGELAARGIPYIDVASAIGAACRDSGRNAESVYVGGHLDAWANRVAAETIFDWFVERLGTRLSRR